ncbi:hypothetical protein RHMOL_Rhmol04G0159400 [Rhododendron molle]|uniref:Uncharacterized protein n=1 Tax=Rhododendron molle TaxID=49168 RepID=A0ACC0P146_RHOML|nr:hypothetical protein RHMOL_Rhmol04G0159400 [Rhododendron molle]
MVTVEGFTTHHIGALIGRVVLYMELRGFMVAVSKPFLQGDMFLDAIEAQTKAFASRSSGKFEALQV